MKILIIRMYPYTLNIKSYNCQELGLAKALIDKGNQCDIVLYTDKNEYEEDIPVNQDKNIHIYYLNAKNFLKNCYYNKKIYEIADRYDVIQTAEYDQMANVRLYRKYKDKLVVYHGPYGSKYTKGYNIKCIVSDIYFRFNKKYKEVTCIAKSELATEFLKKKGFKNVKTIGVGLDSERFEKISVNQKDFVRINEGINLLYIGKLEDRRNIPFLIDILANLKEKNIKLTIVGNGDEKYVEKCFEYAKNRGVYNKILYYKSLKQEDLPELYKASDIFLLPTKYEIFGMVLLEAMYFGLPVITTMNGGSSLLIQHGVNGYIEDINNIENWCADIIEVCQNSSKKVQFANKNRKLIEDKYLWDKIADNILEIYQKK